MGKQRADLGFGSELENFNPKDWTPTPARRTPPEAAREAASQAGFRSREAAPVPPAEPARAQRRRRTGRNAQFNIKAKPETIEAFTAIADAQGWGLGETLEQAVALLQREYGR
jgi:hypothetical protein